MPDEPKPEAGSLVKLIMILSAEDAERLFWAFHSGELDGIGVVDVQYDEKEGSNVRKRPDPQENAEFGAEKRADQA